MKLSFSINYSCGYPTGVEVRPDRELHALLLVIKARLEGSLTMQQRHEIDLAIAEREQ